MAKAIRACIVQNYRRNHYSEGVNKKCLTPSYQFVIVLLVSKSVRSETMDTILKRSYLYDFYGELLTEHQKEIYDGYVNQDLSMTEIADEYSISKQAVSSIVKRCDEAFIAVSVKVKLAERRVVNLPAHHGRREAEVVHILDITVIDRDIYSRGQITLSLDDEVIHSVRQLTNKKVSLRVGLYGTYLGGS